MKKKIIVALGICFLLSSLAIGNASGQERLNSYEWSKKDDWFKMGFISGWFMGIEIVLGELNSSQKVDYYKLKSGELNRDQMEKNVGHFTGSMTTGQILGMIDKIYSDPRTKNWEIWRIMPLVRGRLIEGWTERDLDEAISFLIKYFDLCEKKGQTETLKIISGYEIPKVLMDKKVPACR